MRRTSGLHVLFLTAARDATKEASAEKKNVLTVHRSRPRQDATRISFVRIRPIERIRPIRVQLVDASDDRHEELGHPSTMSSLTVALRFSAFAVIQRIETRRQRAGSESRGDRASSRRSFGGQSRCIARDSADLECPVGVRNHLSLLLEHHQIAASQPRVRTLPRDDDGPAFSRLAGRDCSVQ